MQTGSVPSPDNIATLRIFKNQGADINYLGRKYGLDGWLVSRGNNLQVVYTTSDGQGTVVGLLYGADGNVATGTQLVEAKARGLSLPNTTIDFNAPNIAGGVASATEPAMASGQPLVTSPSAVGASSGSMSRVEALFAQMPQTTYISFGPAAAPPLYVFMDPNCHFCHDYYGSLQSDFLSQGKFQLRVVPVAILGADSQHKAEQILSSKDPAKAWDDVEHGNVADLPSPTSTQDIDKKLTANRAIMLDWKMTGTPGSIYRGKDGKVRLVYGVPNDVRQVAADLHD